ncbi:MAG: hypothetical protein WD623_17375 [Marinobacter sp.]|uniref:hypothetical protein n=1 Tax=Marinobacter sp. TaxID=50741 RepID=UPI0034A01B23
MASRESWSEEVQKSHISLLLEMALRLCSASRLARRCFAANRLSRSCVVLISSGVGAGGEWDGTEMVGNLRLSFMESLSINVLLNESKTTKKINQPMRLMMIYDTTLAITTAEKTLNQDIAHSIETPLGSLQKVFSPCPQLMIDRHRILQFLTQQAGITPGKPGHPLASQLQGAIPKRAG